MCWSVLRILFKGLVFRAVTATVLVFATVVVTAVQDESPVLIQSLESKTAEGEPVFNNISFRQGIDRDVWLMQQSHEGRQSAPEHWDRIAIIVDHKEQRSARFAQLAPGRMTWQESESDELSKRATCFMCHPNGPRAIRPDLSLRGSKVNMWNRLRIFFWNMRIKTYGLVSTDQNADPTFRLQSEPANEVLQVKACMRCHSPDAWMISRGFLTKQNYPAIEFMLKHDLMPPPGFPLSGDEKNAVLQFIGKS